MSEWNEENIKEHMFTEVQMRDTDCCEWIYKKLVGFTVGAEYPFRFRESSGCSYRHRQMRLIPPKPKSLKIDTSDSLEGFTVVELLTELVDKHNALVDLVEGNND